MVTAAYVLVVVVVLGAAAAQPDGTASDHRLVFGALFWVATGAFLLYRRRRRR
jgi:hypothetical protein